MTLLCTAGHVDHGKSALVKALTGVDPDRLAEERRRGMTIELGFVEWRLPGGSTASIIDVPGHRRLIRTMAAGAHAVDGVLLVVSAVEGVMPQTREHLDVCRLLGPRPVLGIVSMADRAHAKLVEQREREVADLVRRSGAELVDVVAVSARSGAGLDDLAAAVATGLVGRSTAQRRGEPRLHVDRAFVMRGRGLVVTGTVLDGDLATGDAVRVLPGGQGARIRRIERHGSVQAAAPAGARAALNLHGVAHDAVHRGDTVVRGDTVAARTRFALSVELLTAGGEEAEMPERATVHHGTRSCSADLRVIAWRSPSEVFAELRCSRPLAALPGDRILLRGPSGDASVGGGLVLEVEPRVRKRCRAAQAANLSRRLTGALGDLLVAEVAQAADGVREAELRGRLGVAVDTLHALIGRAVAAGAVTRCGELVASTDAASSVRGTILKMVDDRHARAPSEHGVDVAALGEPARRRLTRALASELVASGVLCAPRPGLVARAGWHPDGARAAELLSWLEARGLEPATAALVRARFPTDAMTTLLASRRAVRLGEGFVAASALEAAARSVGRFLHANGAATTGELCRALEVSRRVGIPVLEVLDARGCTRREGDRRSLGWREREGNDPSEDAASAPPSRFEDGGVHLDPSAPGADHIPSAPVAGAAPR